MMIPGGFILSNKQNILFVSIEPFEAQWISSYSEYWCSTAPSCTALLRSVQSLMWCIKNKTNKTKITTTIFPAIRCKDLFGTHMEQMCHVKIVLFITFNKTRKKWLCMKISSMMLFCYWLSSLFPRKTTAEIQLLFLCNETILACVNLWGETNKDNYCQRILFILCAASVSGESTCCSQSCLVCWDNQPCLLCYLFIPCSRALSNSYYTERPSDASASRTKLRISGLKPCAFGPTVSNRNKIERMEKEKMGEEERRREKEEKRDCSSGRVQIEFHINVCKFPRSCWLRLEKLISWMQRQYWCHQAERRGAARC